MDPLPLLGADAPLVSIGFIAQLTKADIANRTEQKSRRLENALQRLDPKTGLETASTRPAKGAGTPSGSASH
jgi:hypothetical protein